MRKLIGMSLLIMILDQITKLLVLKFIALNGYISIFSFLKLVHFQNSGAAFSFLHNAGGWQRYFLISISSMARSLWLALPRVATKRTIKVSAAGSVKAVSNHGALLPTKGWLPLNTFVIPDHPPLGVQTWNPRLPMEFPRAW